jgi:hypothetical protein
MSKLKGFWVDAEAAAGQAVILIAITLLAMLMMVGVAIDAGQVYSARRAMQEAADAAAYAGSITLYQGGNQSQAFTAATADATRNGFTHDGTTTWITVAQPTVAPFNTAEFIEVTIVRNVRTTLVPAQSALTQVTVHAIAGANSLNNDYAIIALTSTGAGAFTGGTANISLTGGGIMVNSSASGAASGSSGTWNITCPSANPCNVDVVGTATGTFPVAAIGAPKYYGGVRTSRPVIADPFAGYPKPSTTGMTLNPAGFGPGSNTIGQGIYTGSAISGKSLCHGIYILKGNGMGGDITVDTTSTDPSTGLACDGKVMVFNTTSTYPTSGGTCSTLSWTGNHDVTSLAPMTSGTYKGLVLYQDAACTGDVQLGSTAFDFNVTGTVYVPNAAFRATGGHPNIAGGQIVAKTVDLGAATVTINFTAGTSAQPILPRLSK